MLASIIMPSFRRAELLRWGLLSLSRQRIGCEYEVIVLNDGTEDGTQAACKRFADRLRLRYFFTGQRNRCGIQPRVPGFAINIGVRQAAGDVIVLTCPEILHVGDDVINAILDAVQASSRALATPLDVIDDRVGDLLCSAESRDGLPDPAAINKVLAEQAALTDQQELAFLANPLMPYCMAMRKERFVEIGGYDEDFTGTCADDNDLMDRLVASGCRYSLVDAQIIHLYHGPKPADRATDPRYLHNCRLWRERKGTIRRNVGREWGRLEG